MGLEEAAMFVPGFARRTGTALVLSVVLTGVAVAETGLSRYQGAWLGPGSSCRDVYVSSAKGISFKRPGDPFAQAFIVSDARLQTPTASCRIKSVKASGSVQAFALDCANAVSVNEVKVLIGIGSDGSLKRYFNEQDTIGTAYQRCSP
jgi:hypothetical protein